MTGSLAYFVYGFVLALVMVLVVGGLYAWVAAGKAHKLTWVERRLGSWHKRPLDTEQPPPDAGGDTPDGDSG